MSALRPASLDEYLTWLSAWINKGNQPTHSYDYPWSEERWLTATRDFTLGDECGARAVSILVPAGLRYVSGGLGHNQLYFLDGPKQIGYTIPVFSDPQFQVLPGVAEFIREEQRRESMRQIEMDAYESERVRAARGSDVSEWLHDGA